MSDKILVAYASRTGSTADAAKVIGTTLAESGAQVDVLPIQDVTDLAPYRAAGDEVIVLPGTVHQVLESGVAFLTRVHAISCHGPRDKYVKDQEAGVRR